MNIDQFRSKYAQNKNSEQIVIDCDHEKHIGDRARIIGKQGAERNILKNGEERFICRDCMMKYDNPMVRPRERRQTDDLITVACPHPEHQGPRERQIQKSAWFGAIDGPYEGLCKSCVQLGKKISQEHKEKIKEALTGIKRSDEFKAKLSAHMKNNPEALAKATKVLLENKCTTGMLGKKHSDEVRQKMSESHKGVTFSEEHRKNISEGRKKMLQETGGFTREHREALSRATVELYSNGFNPKTYHIRGYHTSTKVKDLYFSSSYEKKAYEKLDDDNAVAFYEREVVKIPFFHPTKEIDSIYLVDLKVTMTDGSVKWIEIKPASKLKDEVVMSKAEIAKIKSKELGIPYEFWTEIELFGPVYNPKRIQEYADRLRQSLLVDENERKAQEEKRKQKQNKKAKRHYNQHVSSNKVMFHCAFCNTEHSVLSKTYNKNFQRNGRYICEREGGHISGSKPKINRRKDNPYADQGKKQCQTCKEIKLFEEFGTDKSRRDGYATRCKVCRSESALKRYHQS